MRLFPSLLVCLSTISLVRAQSNAHSGYIDKGDSVEFVFGDQESIRIGLVKISLAKRIKEINQVNLAGDFNGWNPTSPKYEMIRSGGTQYVLRLSKHSLGRKGDIRKFKFVLNHTYWVEPPDQATNVFTGADGNKNLTIKLNE